MSGALPDLSRLVSLMTPTRLEDGGGGYSEEWTELGKLWAEIKPRTGAAVAEGTLPIGRVGYRITVRAAMAGSPRRPIPGQQMVHGTRVYRIESVTELDSTGRFLVCTAREEEVAT